MDKLLLAAQIAARAHAKQLRKDGTPYVAHVVRVMLRVRLGDEWEAMNVEAKTVALLHDVVEDSDMTLEELRDYGFSEGVIMNVDALTRRPGETYNDFITRVIAAGPVAIAVKKADIADNMEDQSALEPEEAEFLRNRYQKALTRLG